MSLTLSRIQNRHFTLAVIGLGYVGLPLIRLFAQAKIKSLGLDIDPVKVNRLKEGKSYIHHIPSDDIAQLVEGGYFDATCDYSRVKECQAVIICVPTPLDDHLEPDLSFVENTAKAIAPHLAEGTLVCLESTTWPGTTEEVLRPIVEKGSAKKLFIAYSPEREDPGNRKYSTEKIPKLVGGSDPESLALAAEVYRTVIGNVIEVSSTQVAEAAKILENTFRCVNIALVNELKIVFSKMGIDVWEVIQAAATKPFGFMPFWPGPGLGGHCIPIDPFYLTWKAKQYGVRTRFIELSGEVNRAMPDYVVERVQDCLNDHYKPVRGSKILLWGMAYKPDVDDLRESPSLELMSMLLKKGAHVDYYDPYIPEVPVTRNHPDLGGKRSVSPGPDYAKYDCFLISTGHSCFSGEEIRSYGVPIVDTRRVCVKGQGVYSA